MCMYCERRTDVKFGWEQPKLPFHNQSDISANLSGNVVNYPPLRSLKRPLKRGLAKAI